MDRQSFHGGIRSTNVSNGDQGRNGVDLTLKLGLPYQDNNPSHIRQHVHPVLTTSDLANFNFSGPYSHQEAPSSSVTGQGNINHFEMMNRQTANIINYGMVNQQPNAVMGNIQNNPNGGPSFNMNGWPGEHRNYMNTSGILMNNQQCNYSGAVMGVPAYPMNMTRHHQYYNNYGLGHQISQSPNLMIDNNQLGETSGSSSSSICGRKNSRSQRCGSSNVDPNKRCTNYNCNTNDTPMWRKGPLGPKTLCNACGIKYRKEGEKRRAKEAAKNSNG